MIAANLVMKIKILVMPQLVNVGLLAVVQFLRL
jgi:hypothetical protein